jgi:UDP-N-acetylmuramyl pentapeptide phosphotransferase/UDP-N-acetylglucosamine-1-phosphate transferase
MNPASAVAMFAVAVVVSAILTALGRRYALRRQLLDMPGQRRSHARTTPRGGGVGPILTILVGGGLLVLMHPAQTHVLGGCLLGMLAVAVVGWLDDHRARSAWLRLAVHIAAASVAAVALLGVPVTLQQGLLLALAIFWIASLINAWNFMDGIDGLAATQAVLAATCVLVGGLLYAWLDPAWIAFALVFAGALLGFLPFNFPRARIFLGDVGSGALGFAIACLLLRAIVSDGMSWPVALLPVSAFLVDAGLTLIKRIVQGSAWWRPHREHLYQWLVRRGISHSQVTLAYGLWTLAVCMLALAIADLAAGMSACIVVAALLSAIVLWNCIRKRLWINARTSKVGGERQ